MSARGKGLAAATPFDAGLQAERTLLAWRRTSLSLAAASVAGARVFLDIVGPAAIVLGALGLVFAAGAYVTASARYRRAHASLHADATLPGGALPHLALTLALVVMSGTALAFVLLGGGPIEIVGR
ncbi:DUF202 domain-containing protein [Microbacterium sp. STN6]|uniref:YidH family protein n=1 Tax=Microbacterium sp. STN6 TaxID=2995588 RepID=UPI002260EABB|nr:DUF202 domain-containing protein [Microbacterium sp. STN6]MCX7522713.1 DUF202 domain-containing protein [Microbacterium sp. STN6]